VFQNGVPFFQPEELTNTLAQMQRTFRYCGVYVAVVPSYIGGFMALTWVSQDAILGDPAKWTGLESAFSAARLKTDYYTPAVHRAAFALPAWIERLVKP
jgi:spermidine synthase